MNESIFLYFVNLQHIRENYLAKLTNSILDSAEKIATNFATKYFGMHYKS